MKNQEKYFAETKEGKIIEFYQIMMYSGIHNFGISENWENLQYKNLFFSEFAKIKRNRAKAFLGGNSYFIRTKKNLINELESEFDICFTELKNIWKEND